MGVRVLLPASIAMVIVVASCGSAVVPATASPIATPTATSSHTPTASELPRAVDHDRVYFSRDRLPPVAAHVDGAGRGPTAEARILARLRALYEARAPAGLYNAVAPTKARPQVVTVSGDLATVDFAVPGGDWGTAGSAGTRAFIQQLIYTASEEPGIRRVLITEHGGQAIIGGEGVVIDHPATRDEVAGYSFRASLDAMTRSAPSTTPVAVTARLSLEDDVRALTRLVVAADAMTTDGIAFTARMMPNDETANPELGKWLLVVDLPNASTSESAGLTIVDRTPVRGVRLMAQAGGLHYEIGLDDLRPWRTAIVDGPPRLVVDVGGDPLATSPNIALYTPVFGTALTAGGTVAGLVRAFEAQYEYRIRDARNEIVASGFGTASVGTSQLWGAFAFALPRVPAGPVTLEVFLRSARDGEIGESAVTSLRVSD